MGTFRLFRAKSTENVLKSPTKYYVVLDKKIGVSESNAVVRILTGSS